MPSASQNTDTMTFPADGTDLVCHNHRQCKLSQMCICSLIYCIF